MYLRIYLLGSRASPQNFQICLSLPVQPTLSNVCVGEEYACCLYDSLTALEGEGQQFGGGEGVTGLAQLRTWEMTGVQVPPPWALKWLELGLLSGLP